MFLSAPTDQIDGKVYNVVGENTQKTALVALVRAQFPNASVAVNNKAPDLRDYRVGATRFVEVFQRPPRRFISDAFNETVDALRSGIFRDPFWEGHSAIPLDPSLIN